MPFIIKSSKSTGTRTAQVVEQPESSTNRSELIEMLRGLTFKFEVKLADIIDEKSGSTGGNMMAASTRNLEDQIAERVQEALKKSSANQSQSSNQSSTTFRYYPESDDNRPKTLPENSIKSTLKDKEAQLAERMSRIGIDQQPEQEHEIKQQTSFRDESPFREPTKETIKAVKFDQNYPSSKPINSLSVKIDRDETQTNNVPRPTMMIPPQVKQLNKPTVAAASQSQTVTPTPAPIAAKPSSIRPQQIPTPDPVLCKEQKELIYQIGSVIEACCVSCSDDGTAYLTRSSEALVEVTSLIESMMNDLNEMDSLKSVQIGQLVLAKSSDDDNWYRAIIEAKYGAKIGVDFVDWGMKEIVDMKDLRDVKVSELALDNIAPCAVMIRLKDSDATFVEEFSQCEEVFKAKVLDYDENKKVFGIKLLEKINVN